MGGLQSPGCRTRPAGNYEGLSDFQTWICALSMLPGRLEIFSFLVLFTPVYRRK